MNKNYLPFYNRLNDKEKTFWLDCTKEELIDHLIANINNGEKLLNRIDKAIENLFELKDMIYEPKTREINFDVQRKISETIKILGDKENE